MLKGFKVKLLITGVFFLILMLFILHIPRVKPVVQKEINQIRIMSYNLRYSASDYDMFKKRKWKLM
ncbi:hypothetical protein SAMN02745912_01628 [Paramaledivibacter caminithermalis DSM 15212]|uniref:Uncharacterized protein n=1 Tax=Paramaledivibacter caminithermalis (strain DSM 15212 / CIP 107654 / DViRD3) TaxID=1121301 RepID=A0A1M6NAA9_PARC5|nr:hypothetical protein SAMN02745912_01628 [Paramaledivibacter caminithermalis DSM 15212]